MISPETGKVPRTEINFGDYPVFQEVVTVRTSSSCFLFREEIGLKWKP